MNNNPTPAPETAEYYRGAIAALDSLELLVGFGIGWADDTREACQERVDSRLSFYRAQLRALTPPAIASDDVAIAPEVEVAGPTWELVDACEKALGEARQGIKAFRVMTAMMSKYNCLPIPSIIETANHNCPIINSHLDDALALIAQAKEVGR